MKFPLDWNPFRKRKEDIDSTPGCFGKRTYLKIGKKIGDEGKKQLITSDILNHHEKVCLTCQLCCRL